MMNLIRQGRLTSVEIVRKARARYKLSSSLTNALNGLYRQSSNAVAQGQASQYMPSNNLSGTFTSNIPVAPGLQGKYVYDVLITVKDNRTGRSSVYSHRFYFDSLMSQDDIQSYIDNNINTYVVPLSPVPFAANQASRSTINVQVIGAGRGVQ